jgi:hypothetical protein
MALNTSNNYKSNKTKSKLVCSNCKKLGHLEKSCYLKYPHLSSRNKKTINNTKVSNKKETILVTNSYNNNNKSITIDFILDSGATVYTCYIKDLFNSITPTDSCIKWGNTNKYIAASGIGDINLWFTSTNTSILLKNVLYIPELGVNLLSVNLITNKDLTLSFNKKSCIIYLPNKAILAIGEYINSVTVFKICSSKIVKSIDKSNNTLAILSTYSREDIEELDSNNELDLINPNLEEEEITIDRAIELEDNNSSSSNSNNNNNSKKEELIINNNSIELLHKRLGHISLKSIEYLSKNTITSILDKKDINNAKVSLDNYIIYI